MHSRCCWPPESAPPGASRRSLTSFQRPAAVRQSSTRSSLLVRDALAGAASGRRARSRGSTSPGTGWASGRPCRCARRASMGARRRRRCRRRRAAPRRRARARHQLVHPVEDAQEGRLAAARRADQRGHLVGLHDQRDAVEHLVVAEPGADPAATSSRAGASVVQRCVGVSCLDGSGHVLLLLNARAEAGYSHRRRGQRQTDEHEQHQHRQPVHARSWTLAVELSVSSLKM